MYERLSQPPISRSAFIRRFARHLGAVLAVMLASISIGILAYMNFEGFGPVDAFLHAASLLSTQGLIGVPASSGGKLFAGVFALYAGLVFVATFGILLAPILHRILHKFHWDGGKGD